jgi:hypothetical protein
MLLNPNQIEELLKIIDKNQLTAISVNLGPDFLSASDQELLMNSGVDYEYLPEGDPIFSQFNYGLLSEALGQTAFEKLTYEQLKEYIRLGQYIPLTFSEQAAIQTIKRQTLNDLKTLDGKIFKDVNQILINNTLKEQQEFIKQEIATGLEYQKTVANIAHTISEKTGDWSRDFERIVAYNSHQAIEEGKAAMIQRNAEGEEALVYKLVFNGACNHCITLYLTNGAGSEPRIFKLSELKKNGTNIGRKTKEWKATIGPIHPYCRCSLHNWREGMMWDQKLQIFTEPIPYKPLRKLIRVWIGGKEEYI